MVVKMKIKVSLIVFGVLICVALAFIACVWNALTTPHTDILNHTITNIEVNEESFTVRGRLHTMLDMIDGYSYRIEKDYLYIRIYVVMDVSDGDTGGRRRFIEYEHLMTDDINKIFIEDDRNSILIWERTQGYGLFNVEEYWREEIRKIREQ